MGNCFPAGIDIGSTTVKLVILDTNGQILFGQYRRHRAHTQETLAQLLREARQQLGPCSLRVGITGSGSMNLGKAHGHWLRPRGGGRGFQFGAGGAPNRRGH